MGSVEHAPCFVCGQIAGDREQDLIARMLPTQLYRRRVVVENQSFAVIPSLGPLVEGHVLLCPKTHATSFASLGRAPDADRLEADYRMLRLALVERLGTAYRGPVYVFEHGMAAARGARVPCTTDHAHLHLLPLADTAQPLPAELESWQAVGGSLASLADHVDGAEYLLYEAPDSTRRVYRSERASVESQRMRRIFARVVGHGERWDWRAAPAPEIADATFHRLTEPLSE